MPRQSLAYRAYRESSRFQADVEAGKIAGQGGVPRGIVSHPTTRVNKVKPRARMDIPKKMVDIAKSPVIGGAGAVVDLWTMGLGSREDKVNTAMEYMPVNEVVRETVKNVVDQSAGSSPSAGAYWGEQVVGATDIKTSDVTAGLIPDFSGLKGSIIAVAIIGAGVYLLGSFLGRK